MGGWSADKIEQEKKFVAFCGDKATAKVLTHDNNQLGPKLMLGIFEF